MENKKEKSEWSVKDWYDKGYKEGKEVIENVLKDELNTMLKKCSQYYGIAKGKDFNNLYDALKEIIDKKLDQKNTIDAKILFTCIDCQSHFSSLEQMEYYIEESPGEEGNIFYYCPNCGRNDPRFWIRMTEYPLEDYGIEKEILPNTIYDFDGFKKYREKVEHKTKIEVAGKLHEFDTYLISLCAKQSVGNIRLKLQEIIKGLESV